MLIDINPRGEEMVFHTVASGSVAGEEEPEVREQLFFSFSFFYMKAWQREPLQH